MNYITLICSVFMCVVTIALMVIRIRMGSSLDTEGRSVSIGDNPLYFWMFLLFNFTFLLSISIAMIVLAIFFS
jgi:hypothetical protein